MGGWLDGGHECKVEDVNETAAAKNHITGGEIPAQGNCSFYYCVTGLVAILIGS